MSDENAESDAESEDVTEENQNGRGSSEFDPVEQTERRGDDGEVEPPDDDGGEVEPSDDNDGGEVEPSDDDDSEMDVPRDGEETEAQGG